MTDVDEIKRLCKDARSISLAIEKVVTKRIERKRVPTAFEEQDVEVEDVSWNCGKDDDPAVGDVEAIAGADHADNVPF